MRLLLCEDEIQLSKALVAILKHSNYSIDAVYNGQSALEYLETENYDVVLLDIMMPKVDGLTVLKELRRKGNMVPVIMLTALGQVDDKVQGLDLGANDYLTKPFETKELLARIRAVTRNQDSAASSLLKLGNVTLDRASFEVSSPLLTIKLANKEFQMLEMMMLNPRYVIPTEKFMEKIWGYDSDSELQVVWVCISTLRKKLINMEANIQISVKRNTGYCLEEK
ncbi:response regulator transcription factor [Tannockella kyphosi]|uniref:response regulator transcription factor n=1 Tax=Tannockella kyphosi TaxID=2899121 RepID=UPI0020131FF8|nr:response regulator transcription factor [Tannockella kyphosi]